MNREWALFPTPGVERKKILAAERAVLINSHSNLGMASFRQETRHRLPTTNLHKQGGPIMPEHDQSSPLAISIARTAAAKRLVDAARHSRKPGAIFIKKRDCLRRCRVRPRVTWWSGAAARAFAQGRRYG